MPVVATPSTRYFWKNMNTSRTGTMDSVVIANKPDQLVCVDGSENIFSAMDSGYILGLLK